MKKHIGVVVWLAACAAVPAVPDAVEEEIARLEGELAKYPGELVVTTAADLPFSAELEEQLATAGRVIHIDSGGRAAAYVGYEHTNVPEGVPVRRMFRSIAGDVIVAEQDLLGAFLVQEDPQQAEVASVASLPIGHGRQWPESTVAYTINANIQGTDRETVLLAISRWNTALGLDGFANRVRFVPRYAGDGRPYVDFVKGGSGGCGSSRVGRHDWFLSNWYSHSIHIDCFSIRTIQHEMGHTVGLHHEHQRCDRNDFVAVSDPEPVNCAVKCDGDGVTFGPYNYLSVMHYGYGSCGMSAIGPQTDHFRGNWWDAGALQLDAGDVEGIAQSYFGRPKLPPIGWNQQFTISPVHAPSKVIHLPLEPVLDGTHAKLTDRTSGLTNQHFWIIDDGPGTVRIRPVHAWNKCLDALNFATNNGAPIGIWQCVDVANQKWIVAPNAGNPTSFDLINVHSGKSLDVTAWGTANGTAIQQWDHLNGTNQRFTLLAPL